MIGVALTPRFSAGETIDYATQIKPILSSRCYACHSALRKKSGLRLDTAAALIEGGDAGPAIVPGKSAESYLIEMLTGATGTRMPPEDDGAALTAEQIELIRKWIDQGAHAPPETPQPDPRDHWSYQPPQRPAVPQVKNAPWVRNPIDAFVASQHESQGLTPVAESGKAALLRRVYLDLVGLPPTRDELTEFLANDSPRAYEEVVDRLLASPQYGERWGRHWMDVWRYSDWAGYKEEVRDSAKHIWRWRDWIVESLNADKGYDQMVVEMLAGDEIAPADQNTLRATGFLARNWYKFSRDVWLANTVEHTSKAFLGVTMNCCRCHDHKFDPISQTEYYQFRAIFEPHEVYTERVAGEPSTDKGGLQRICDMKPEAATYLYERGDEKRPNKSEVIGPGVPESLGSALKVEAVDLPAVAYYPALREFAIEEDLAAVATKVATAEALLAKAQLAVAAARTPLKPEVAAVAAQTNKQGNESTAKNEAANVKEPPGDISQNERALDTAVTAAELAARQVDAARAAQAALRARVAAERAKFGLTNGDKNALAVAASKAEREQSLCAAREQQLVAARELEAARATKNPDDAKTTAAIATAEKKATNAQAALAAAHAALSESSDKYQPLGKELPHRSTGRRLALSKWLADRKNPLSARVAVNHIWARHFGTPLVDSAFDFGLRCPTPRNQPLLDWLAVELMDHGWQMKHIHRQIVTSTTYRMSSAGTGAVAANTKLDRDNLYLWRMNTRRMEAEVVRDAVFYAAGNLDLTRGGPDLAFKLASETPRRSLYFQHAYEKEHKLLELFDSASVNECYRRSESIVPQQALALANSDVTVNESRVLAKSLSEAVSHVSEPQNAFVRLAFQHILNRDPSADEMRECEAFLLSQAELFKEPGKLTAFAGGAKSKVPPSEDPVQRARENLTLVLFNHNDFITIR
jgi:hypothetical protein